MATNFRRRAAPAGRLQVLLTILLLGACGGGGDGPQTGQVSIAVTDAPIDQGIEKVSLQFTGLELKPESGPPIVFDFGAGNERNIDLLQLQGEASSYLILDEAVPAGRYPWVRLLVNARRDEYDSYIEKDQGGRYPLYIPSGEEKGLQLVSGFVVPAGGSADFVIDWNLAQAIHAPDGQDLNHYLRPALRIVDRAASGVIRGTVASELIDENDPITCSGGNRVYLFDQPDGAETRIDDLDMRDDDRAEVLTTSKVENNVDRDTWEFVFGFVSPGRYTLAFTSSAIADDPAVDDYPAPADAGLPESDFTFHGRGEVVVEVAADAEISL
jgi:hypothetical protein